MHVTCANHAVRARLFDAMRVAVATLALLVAVGCGKNPTEPDPVQPPPACTESSGSITLRVLIVGHLTNRPLAGVPAQLSGFSCVQTSGADGIVSWRVTPGQRLTILIRGQIAFRQDIEAPAGDAQWLVSFPE